MESLFIIPVVLFLAGPILGIIAIVKSSNLEQRVRRLKAEVDRLTALQFREPPISSAVTEAEVPAPPIIVATAVETPEPIPAIVEPIAVAEHAPQQPAPRDVEQALASRWFVWVGGIAIALGGLLFVKYAHDNGLIPPVLRIIIGLAFAGGLVAAGEWVRKQRGDAVKDYVPAALSAAGLVIAFGVVYAAYALYDLLSPAICFPALVAIGLGALWLSRRQGPLIAALGLVGSYAAPALVPSDHPNAWGFFAYLLVIVAASLYELRSRPWWWLGFAAIAGAFAWSMLWINGGLFEPSHIWPTGLFALALGAVAVAVPRGRAILDEAMGSLADPQKIAPPMAVAIAGCVAGSLVLAALVIGANHAFASLLLFALGMAAVTGFGWLRNGMVAAPVAAGALSLAVLMVWRDVGFHEWAMDERGFWSTVPGLIEPPRFRNAMFAGLAAFTAVGLLGSLQKAEPRPWAALAAGSAFLFLFGAWGRADFTLAETTWALLGAGLAIILAAMAYRLRSGMGQAAQDRAIEILIGGAVLLALFAFDRTLQDVWYTLAVAMLATAVAWSTRIWPLPNVGGIASAVASFAAIRLFAGRTFWREPEHLPLGPHWVLYGYGIPAILFWQASRWLTGENFTRWRVAFEGISLGLAISLVSLELRVLIGGGVTVEHMGLLELSAHALAWMGAAYGLAYRQHLYSTFVSFWGARILLAASCLGLLAGLTLHNPVISGDAVQGGQVINSLWLAYLAPVALLALMARKLESLELSKFRSVIGVFALVLLITFITLWVKRQFQGPVLEAEFLTQGESYATSLAWLASGIGIFVAGLKLDRQTIRYGGLAILILTVLKVFALDLFALGGLWRIASIIGLGACLIGVGWLYTRFMQPRAKSAI